MGNCKNVKLNLLAFKEVQVFADGCIAGGSVEFVDSPPSRLAFPLRFFRSDPTLRLNFLEVAPHGAVVSVKLSTYVTRGRPFGVLGKVAKDRGAQLIDAKHGQRSFGIWRQWWEYISGHLSIVYGLGKINDMPYNVICGLWHVTRNNLSPERGGSRCLIR